MATLEHYGKLLKEKERERDRLEGQIQLAEEEMEELGFKKVEDVDEYLDKLDEEIKKESKELDKLEKEFEKNYGDFLINES